MTTAEGLACDHALEAKGTFRMGAPGRQRLECSRCAVRNRRMLRRSFLTALVVGTILTLINQGPAIFDGELGPQLAWKIPLTYVVPFLVTTWGALGNAWVGSDREHAVPAGGS